MINEKTGNALLEMVKLTAATQASVCESSEPILKYCGNDSHAWKEDYCGWKCKNCDAFYADGCAPWEYDEDAEYERDQEEYYATHGRCGDCFNEFGDGWSNCECED